MHSVCTLKYCTICSHPDSFTPKHTVCNFTAFHAENWSSSRSLALHGTVCAPDRMLFLCLLQFQKLKTGGDRVISAGKGSLLCMGGGSLHFLDQPCLAPDPGLEAGAAGGRAEAVGSSRSGGGRSSSWQVRAPSGLRSFLRHRTVRVSCPVQLPDGICWASLFRYR